MMRARYLCSVCLSMRIFLSFLCLAVVVVGGVWWFIQRDANSNAAAQAQSLENALQAVEWYTNESVNKALRAEAEGDFSNARLFGDKAIESDLKAQGLRNETAAAWQAAGKPERARDAWRRAAKMADARARMLADRIPLLQKSMEVARAGNPSAVFEAEVAYLQSLIYTAEQWALVVQFSVAATDSNQVAASKESLSKILVSMQHDGLLQRLSGEPRIARELEKIRQWQQLFVATTR